MARYIDTDELRHRIKEKTNPYGKPTLDYESGVKVLNMIDNAPTADVVPKSEVEELARENESLAKTVNEASELIHKLRNQVEKAKAEVAREIFEEIERVIGEKYNHYVFGNNDLDSIGQDAIINFSDDLADCFAKLKKKYTEEK